MFEAGRNVLGATRLLPLLLVAGMVAGGSSTVTSGSIRTALTQTSDAAVVGSAGQGQARLVGSPSVRIAIVDTGVAPLAGLAANIKGGYDLLDGTAADGDGNGHGTAMASIAAARPEGRSGLAGVCSLCTIVPVQVIGNAGIGTNALAAAGIRWATQDHVNVINVSLTSPSDDPDLDAAIQQATAAGIVVVIAAGNNGSTDPAADGYPAASNPEAITVAATDPSGHLYPWSNHGPWVQLAAPGSLPALTLKGKAFTATGTSAAAAYVSGAAALLLSTNPALTPAQVQTILTSTGTPTPGLDVQSDRTVNLQAALTAATA